MTDTKEGIKYIENGTVIDCTYGEKGKCYQVIDALEKQAKEILNDVKHLLLCTCTATKEEIIEYLEKKYLK